jgi:putative sugar O-methyltransferase
LAGVLPDYASVQSYYSAWSGYQASANVINQYYYANILRKFVKPDEVRTVMEIGSGSGNFASIIHHDWVPTRVILVDLPETLAVAIPFLSSLFPKAQLLMPHEVSQKGLNSKFDFAFLTVDQVDSIKENSVDLVINCHSFQEMTHDQIDSYFRLVQKICKPAGLFFVANRIEKIPCGEDAFTTDQVDPPNRFAEYPWNPRNHDLVYEISKLSRLVQLDPIAIRLQRIIK